jgi:hypothetical protein
MSALRPIACLALVLATTGFTCGPSGPPLPETQHRCADLPAPDDGLPALVVGTGEGDGFAPVSGALVREHGPQGGSHVTLTLRLFIDQELFASHGDAWEYDLSLLAGENAEVGASSVGVTACPSGWVESTNVRLFLYDDGPIEGTLHVEARPSTAAAPVAVEDMAVRIE